MFLFEFFYNCNLLLLQCQVIRNILKLYHGFYICYTHYTPDNLLYNSFIYINNSVSFVYLLYIDISFYSLFICKII